MEDSSEAFFDKAAYLAKVDDIIFNSLSAVENKTKNENQIYTEFTSANSTSNPSSVNVLSWIKEAKYQQQQILKQTSYMASPESPKQESTHQEEQKNDHIEPVHPGVNECEEGEIEDTEDEDEEYYDSEEGRIEEEESDGEEEYCEEDYDHWHEQEESSNSQQHEERRARIDSTDIQDDKPSLDSLDDNINMNLQSMKKSAIDKRK